MSNIKLFVMDVDGTLTDGKINMGATGEVFKSFNAKDGYGIHSMLLAAKITPCIITGRTSKIVENRAAELSIRELHQGIENKLQTLKDILKKYSLSAGEVAYIGDDLNDLECMRFVRQNGGVCGCPRDASREVKSVSHFISAKDGGNGAVREFIEEIIKG